VVVVAVVATAILKCKNHKLSENLVVGHIFLLPERDALLWLFASAWCN
jgi:hypothetical protein